MTANLYSQDISMLLGIGNGIFKAAVNFRTGDRPGDLLGEDLIYRPTDVQVVDLNNDGNLDLITANSGWNTASIFFGNGEGAFQTTSFRRVGNHPIKVNFGDLNGDGKLDLISSQAGYTSITLGNGDGSFQTTLNYFASGPTTIADLNNDGKLDLIAGSTILFQP